jgi:hypothetical protein
VSNGSDWPKKYPWKLLPRGGSHPYVPPRPDWLKNPPRGMQRGYVDATGNEWKPHYPSSGGEEDFHWDVQHADGSHTNVGQDGEVHHGADNFS